MKELTTASEVIDALGGPAAVSRLLGTSTNAVCNWRVRGLPPETFLALSEALKGKELYAMPGLWRMKELTR